MMRAWLTPYVRDTIEAKDSIGATFTGKVVWEPDILIIDNESKRTLLEECRQQRSDRLIVGLLIRVGKRFKLAIVLVYTCGFATPERELSGYHIIKSHTDLPMRDNKLAIVPEDVTARGLEVSKVRAVIHGDAQLTSRRRH